MRRVLADLSSDFSPLKASNKVPRIHHNQDSGPMGCKLSVGSENVEPSARLSTLSDEISVEEMNDILMGLNQEEVLELPLNDRHLVLAGGPPGDRRAAPLRVSATRRGEARRGAGAVTRARGRTCG